MSHKADKCNVTQKNAHVMNFVVPDEDWTYNFQSPKFLLNTMLEYVRKALILCRAYTMLCKNMTSTYHRYYKGYSNFDYALLKLTLSPFQQYQAQDSYYSC